MEGQWSKLIVATLFASKVFQLLSYNLSFGHLNVSMLDFVPFFKTNALSKVTVLPRHEKRMKINQNNFG